MDNHAAVLSVVDAYCKGVFTGDVELLRSVFHPKAALFAEVRGQPYYRPLAEYLAVVAARQSPEVLGEPFGMKPLAVEVTHEIALAKVHCPMFDYNYIDYLSLVRWDGEWRIVNKVFTDVPVRDQSN